MNATELDPTHDEWRKGTVTIQAWLDHQPVSTSLLIAELERWAAYMKGESK